MLTMMDKAPLAVVCKDLFYFRQVLSETFNIFFSVSIDGMVVQLASDEVDWFSVIDFVSSPRCSRYLLDGRLMECVGSLCHMDNPFGSFIICPGSSFLHFLCRYDHPLLPRVIVAFHRMNMSTGGVIYIFTFNFPVHLRSRG